MKKVNDIADFALTPHDNQTALILTLTRFPAEAIYRHISYYWTVALPLLKKFVEDQAGEAGRLTYY